MTDLILIKHAAPEIVPAVPSAKWRLSRTGEQQCDELGQRLAIHGPGVLCASEQPKAVETAERLFPHLGIRHVTRPGLQENDRTDLPFFHDEADLDACLQEFFTRPSELVMGNETADQARRRFVSAVEAVAEEAGEQLPAIVSHGTVITLLVAGANQLEPFAFWKALTLSSFVILCMPELGLRQMVRPGS